jgi:hypothetical protein
MVIVDLVINGRKRRDIMTRCEEIREIMKVEEIQSEEVETLRKVIL